MVPKHGKVHVVRVKKIGYVDKQGRRRDYSSAYLRRTYRDGGVVRNETVATLSALPDHVIDLIDAGLKGRRLVPAGEAFTITRALPHGDVAAVAAMSRRLEFAAALGRAGRCRNLALALVFSWVVRPASRQSTLNWWSDVTLGEDLGVAGAAPAEVHAAMDWMTCHRARIETALARRDAPAAAVRPSWAALRSLAERDLRSIEARDLAVHPAEYRLEDRFAAHAMTCLLAAYLTWHLRAAWAPLIQAREDRAHRHLSGDEPVSGDPAQARRADRDQAAGSGAARLGFHGLLAHLATLTRSQIRFPGAEATITVLSEPTPGQCAAFELLGAPIPHTVA